MDKARKTNHKGKDNGATYALLYCRVSSDRQANEGHGLDSQELRCRQFIESQGLVFDSLYQDAASGGGNYQDRAGMNEIIKHIDKFPYRKFVVVVDDLSRLSRDTKAYLTLKEALKNRQVEMMSPNFHFDDTPEGEYIEQVTMAGHELQRKVNRRQVIQKQKARLESGYWPFGSKKGYTINKVEGHGKLAEPNKEGDLLKEALEGFASGVFIRKIDVCRFLLEKGFWKTQRAEKYLDKVTAILRDPFYAGYIEYRPWEVSRRIGQHKSIISLETHELIQKRLRKVDLNERVRIDTSPDFPLRGLIIHDECKGHITGAWYKGRKEKYRKYVCHTAGCPNYNKPFAAKDVEGRFQKVLEKGALKKQVDVLVKKMFDRVWSDEVLKIKTSEQSLGQQKRTLEKRLSDLTNLMLSAKSPAVKRNYEKQIETAANELEAIEGKSIAGIDLNVPYQTALAKATGLLKMPHITWKKLNVHEQHGLFFFLFLEKLSYSIKEGYQTAQIPYAARLFEDFAVKAPQLVEMPGVKPGSKTSQPSYCSQD